MFSTTPWGRELAVFTFIAMILFVPQASVGQPTSTTATYNDWTVRCRIVVGNDKKTIKICEMIHVVSLKKNKQVIAQIAIGRLPKAKLTKIVFQLPIGVWLRDKLTFNLDGKTVMSTTYLACQANSCLADAEMTKGLLNQIKSAKVATLGFSDASRRKNILPISLKGFQGAYQATFGK